MSADPTGPVKEGQGDGSILIWTWALTTANPKGTAVKIPEWVECTWNFQASAVGAATATAEGSNTGADADFAAMANAAGGAAISVTAVPKIITNVENPLYVRPNLSTPGSAAVWTVTLCARRAQPLRT